MKLTLLAPPASGFLLLALTACATGSTSRAPAAPVETSGSEARSATEETEAKARVRETERRRRALADAENRLEDLDAKADRDARPRGERRAKEAFDRLLPFAAVKEEPRGTVVILPASVVFEGGGAELMDTARARLDRVADALAAVPDKAVVVRSHEATTNDARHDLELSRRRAEAVRAYLVTRGVAGARVRADGRGRSEPIASNTTSAGRAENRRIEIVLEGAGPAAAEP